MNQKKLRAAVEAMLFAYAEPIGADKLAQALQMPVSSVEPVLEELRFVSVFAQSQRNTIFTGPSAGGSRRASRVKPRWESSAVKASSFSGSSASHS